MDYNYEQELTETYTRITESGGILYDDPDDNQDGIKYVLTDYDFDGKQETCDRYLRRVTEYFESTIDFNDLDAYDIEDINAFLDMASVNTPNLEVTFNPTTKQVEIKQKQTIAEYCEEHSIYRPETKDTTEVATRSTSFNIADLETSYNEWVKMTNPEWNGVCVELSTDYDYNDPNKDLVDNHPLYLTFRSYCDTIQGGEFSLDSFIQYVNENGFCAIGGLGTLDDYTFDPNSGLITFNFDHSYLDLTFQDCQVALIAFEAYKNKVATDYSNGNQINCRLDRNYLIECLKTSTGLDITADNLDQYLAAAGLSVVYQDGSYLYLSTDPSDAEYDADMLTYMLYLNNNSNSLYKFDSQQLENKANCYLGVSGMELGETFINSKWFDDPVEYQAFVETYGDIGKIYTSTYNGYTVHIPQLLENGKYSDAFTSVPASLFELVNSNEQTLDTLGYSLSVRKDSMIEYKPDEYSCEDYRSIVAITDEEGKITGYKIVLNNNQYEEVYPDGSGNYVLFDPSNDSAVDSVVRRSSAYDCLEITNALREKYSYLEMLYFYQIVKMYTIKNIGGRKQKNYLHTVRFYVSCSYY